jgi:chemotaxis protein histidine kinase CheA
MSEMDEIIREFLVESHEGLDQLDRDLVELEKHPDSADLLARIFRSIHTIKGTGGVLGFPKLEALAHGGENLLSRLRDRKLRLSPQITSALLAMADALRWYLKQIESAGQEGERDFEQTKAALAALLKAEEEPAAEPPVSALPAAPVSPTPVSPTHGTPPDTDAAGAASPPELLGEILVKSAAITESAVHAALRQQAQGDPRRLGQILVEGGEVQPQAVLEALNAQGDARLAAMASSIRVDVGLLDKVMDLVGELVLARNQILQFTFAKNDPGFLSTAQRLNLITTELQEGVMKTRMQPIGNIWNKLPRVVRDLALNSGKQVRLELEGSETELDKTIIEAVKDPLTHIVRNSVDHGIEPPEVRRSAGKPAEGRLLLRAFHEGGQVNIEISDDGAGINLARVKEKAIARGLISAEMAARMTDRELTNLIFLAGFSTAEKVTNVSGRGVGMDVVKTNIEKIGGVVDIHSTSGQGTTIKIKIPLTLAIIPALIVTSSGERFAIPQVNLLELVRLDGEQSGKSIENLHGAPVYRLRGNLLPLVFLDQELRLSSSGNEASRTAGKLDSTFDFESAKAKHLDWKRSLREFLQGKVHIDGERAGAHKMCALGKWLYGHARNVYAHVAELDALEARHAQLHSELHSVIVAHESGNHDIAQEKLRTVDALCAEVADLLSALQQIKSFQTTANIVVLQADQRQFGLVVDEINDTEEIVVKPLSKQLKGINSFAGATIMGDGQVALILDVLGLAQKASIVSEGQERAISEAVAGGLAEAREAQSWLVFQAGTNSQMAVPLSLVSRLEEFAPTSIEKAGQNEVVQYRGHIMPLLRVSHAMGVDPGASSEAPLQVIVYSDQNQSVGLVVDRILDVVEQHVVVERRSGHEALMGSAVIRQRVTDLLDIPRLVAGMNAAMNSMEPRS